MSNNEKKFEEPEFEFIVFEAADVIITSGTYGEEDEEGWE